MWKTIISRQFAIIALSVLVAMLILSAFIPNHMTVPEQEWLALEQSSPVWFWIASRFSTPYLVSTPLFLLGSLLLFLSTLACTVDRVRTWNRSRTLEFSKDKVFSFQLVRESHSGMDGLQGRVEELLSHGAWQASCLQQGETLVISGQRGTSGFWGSIIFHVGLILCFLAGPVTALTSFKGSMVVTGDQMLPFRQAVSTEREKDAAALPDVRVMVHDIKGEYYKGNYKYAFGGVLTVEDGTATVELPFAVNEPALYRGYQLSLHEYGYAPHLVMETAGRPAFDFYLNLRHPDQGDYFDVGNGLRAFVMFFPDFVREGRKIGSRSKDANNPVVMVKLLEGDREVFKALFKPGEDAVWGDTRIRVPDYKQWVNLIVTREGGLYLLMVGFFAILAGLMLRFMSNERRIEFELSPTASGTSLLVKGYSRYYPAFLEKEVSEMAHHLVDAA